MVDEAEPFDPTLVGDEDDDDPVIDARAAAAAAAFPEPAIQAAFPAQPANATNAAAAVPAAGGQVRLHNLQVPFLKLLLHSRLDDIIYLMLLIMVPDQVLSYTSVAPRILFHRSMEKQMM